MASFLSLCCWYDSIGFGNGNGNGPLIPHGSWSWSKGSRCTGRMPVVGEASWDRALVADNAMAVGVRGRARRGRDGAGLERHIYVGDCAQKQVWRRCFPKFGTALLGKMNWGSRLDLQHASFSPSASGELPLSNERWEGRRLCLRGGGLRWWSGVD